MRATKYVAEGHGAPGFPIETSVSYKVLVGRNLGQAGEGRTIGISSKVVTFVPDGEIPNAVGLELTVDWPAPSLGSIMTRLLLYGVVISTDASETTMKVRRYQFRMNLKSACEAEPVCRILKMTR